jgi:hypothetical protein
VGAAEAEAALSSTSTSLAVGAAEGEAVGAVEAEAFWTRAAKQMCKCCDGVVFSV